MSERIGFIGLGNMGQPMALNLLKAGFELSVYNRNPARAEPLVAQGAQQVFKPGEVAEPGGIVVTMVANDSALESVDLTLHAEISSNGQDQDRDRQHDAHKFQRKLHSQHHTPQRSHPMILLYKILQVRCQAEQLYRRLQYRHVLCNIFVGSWDGSMQQFYASTPMLV